MGIRAALHALAIAAATLLSSLAHATVQISGSFDAPGGDMSHVEFSCLGSPVCSGVYSQAGTIPGCPNAFGFTGDFALTGVNLAAPGSFSGTLSLSKEVDNSGRRADGSCIYSYPDSPDSVPYTGTWDGTRGTVDFVVFDGATAIPLHATFTATGTGTPPVFPLTVTGSITPTTANASAQFEPRPEDVGKSVNVYVFFHAPASLVQGAKRGAPGGVPSLRLDGPDQCVLAQLGANGELHAASADNLVPAASGVLSAQGQSVTMMNNVATPNVQGTATNLGYAVTSAEMFANGTYEAALNVPGTTTSCGTELSASAIPQSPAALSGLWWNAGESGWGVDFTQRRNVIFAAWYTYDALGKPKWYIASACTMPSGTTGTTGTCDGALYEATASDYFGAPFDPLRVRGTEKGTLRVSFQDANSATMTYTLAGSSRTVPITRQVFASGPTPPAIDFTDLWWNDKESGWGIAISHQFGAMFLAWFVYDAQGNATWYVASNCVVNGNSCSGALFRTTGPPFGPTFDATTVHADTAGTVSIVFTNANKGTLTYTVGGVTGTKTIVRQTF